MGSTAGAEAMAVVGTYLQTARAVEGLTTYGSTVDRFDVVCALAEAGELYVVDANTGELVIRYSDLAACARMHFGCSLPHGWLAGRMGAAGWSRVGLEGWREAGRAGAAPSISGALSSGGIRREAGPSRQS